MSSTSAPAALRRVAASAGVGEVSAHQINDHLRRPKRFSSAAPNAIGDILVEIGANLRECQDQTAVACVFQDQDSGAHEFLRILFKGNLSFQVQILQVFAPKLGGQERFFANARRG